MHVGMRRELGLGLGQLPGISQDRMLSTDRGLLTTMPAPQRRALNGVAAREVVGMRCGRQEYMSLKEDRDHGRYADVA